MNFEEYKQKALAENSDVRAEYDRLGPLYEAIGAVIARRRELGLTHHRLPWCSP